MVLRIMIMGSLNEWVVLNLEMGEVYKFSRKKDMISRNSSSIEIDI
jgi:hypothetical protein